MESETIQSIGMEGYEGLSDGMILKERVSKEWGSFPRIVLLGYFGFILFYFIVSMTRLIHECLMRWMHI